MTATPTVVELLYDWLTELFAVIAPPVGAVVSTSTAAVSTSALLPTLSVPTSSQKKHLPSASVAASLPAVIVATMPVSHDPPPPEATAGQLPEDGFAEYRFRPLEAMPEPAVASAKLVAERATVVELAYEAEPEPLAWTAPGVEPAPVPGAVESDVSVKVAFVGEPALFVTVTVFEPLAAPGVPVKSYVTGPVPVLVKPVSVGKVVLRTPDSASVPPAVIATANEPLGPGL